MKYIKHLGLTAVMALALTAFLGVASSSAATFNTESTPATISSEGGSHNFTFNGFAAECSNPTLAAEMKASSTSILIATASNASCDWSGELKWNGCKPTFYPGTETSKGYFGGTMKIGPAGCGPVSITNKFSGTCEVTISPRIGLPATYHNVGTGSKRTVEISLALTGLTYTEKHLSGSCANGTFSNGSWFGSWTVKSSNTEKKQQGIWLENGPEAEVLFGIAIKGKESKEEGGGPKLVPEEVPTSISGKQVETNKLKFAGGTAECGTAQLSGSVTGSTTTLPLQAEYSGCTASGGFASTLSMNGCEYVAHVLNKEPAWGGLYYYGSADIKCPAGKSIVIVATLFGTTKCTTTIPAQTGLEELRFHNEESGSILLTFNLGGIKYQEQAGTGFGACASGEYSNGTYTGTSLLTPSV